MTPAAAVLAVLARTAMCSDVLLLSYQLLVAAEGLNAALTATICVLHGLGSLHGTQYVAGSVCSTVHSALAASLTATQQHASVQLRNDVQAPINDYTRKFDVLYDRAGTCIQSCANKAFAVQTLHA